MQARMKQYPLPDHRISALLATETVGRLATAGADGYPYVTPVHFVYLDGSLFFHGLAAGEKLKNIKSNPLVCFEAERMVSLIHDPARPCDTNTEYESVIIRGDASLVDDTGRKVRVLDAIVAKYAPQHSGTPYPPAMLRMTAIIEIAIRSCTGKYYPAPEM